MESIEKRKQSDDLIIQLASIFEENMGKLQAIVSQQPSHFSSTPTASSSPRGSNPDDVMDAFYSPAELAEYSRTGKVCPTKTGTIPKKKFPNDILNVVSVLLQVVGQHGTTEQLLKKPLSMLQWDITCLNATPTLARER
ncbi:hypothetical protein OUZ56_003654 [Daphnia magna]|uniref:Uncharacterized protein n=1 Tax=Daphnia magna TaxID=35525 RepID=A0ABR0A9Q2_9CRUS|nr:hypothetical protein OUZ56_003654 [Daphnia magna]